MPSVEFRNISETYYSNEENEVVNALENINLKVNDGEFLCILGPSGCGKSTLLEIGAGLLAPTGGEVLFDDVVQRGTTRKIGVVFQDSSLFPWRNVRKNVQFGLELEKIEPAEIVKKVQDAIELVGLSGFEEKYPHQLSGGMRQRAGLARTLVNDPAFIFMDEPFSAVDHLTRLTLQEELIKIWQKKQKTITLITHDVSEAVFLASRIVVLTPRPGRIQKIIDVPYSHPRNRNSPGLLDIVEKIYMCLNNPEQKNALDEYTI
jgi:NitT/TauT family transport system ATP-binding protein